ncbi:MAG: IS630 family transposase [Phycisphaerae bacterium]|jgi:transposase
MVDWSRAEKRQLRIWIQRQTDAGLRTRMSIPLHLERGRPGSQVADSLHLARSTAYRVAERFRSDGFARLADRREDNGWSGVDASSPLTLRHVMAGSPHDYGWARPTWTQELLRLVLARQTSLRVSQPTTSRCLKANVARLGRPRPVVGCPCPKSRGNRHARRIRRLIAKLPADEVALYADEADIHLNPRLVADWMLPGQPKAVLTPGQNVKRYPAGALEVRRGRSQWATAAHKRSGLFVDLLRRLDRVYPAARRIHVIVDKHSVHSSRQTQLALASLPRLRLHFLLPHCQDLNPIERDWLDLHAEVTRNHRCATIDELMRDVHNYLAYRNRTRS